ncbi:MAG TPA: FAD-dependent oxidoreductase, partial [Terriglobales bacterium]|nr:FAD-dependent oxidoreductase [Terriglobales bacterium]
KTFIYDIGEGGPSGKQIKAVQTGGPSGGCIPADMFDTAVDYESLASLGSIMGSGGMVVMDEDNCMVDVARYFIEFTHSESCGKCVPCRVGLNKCLRILNQVTAGGGAPRHIDLLDELSHYIRECSLCGLGQTAPNPVLTTLRHFRNEFEDHIVARRCTSGVCEELALSPCENSCPLHMNIPRFLQLFKEKRLEEAFESVLFDNPLPASTGRVCQHPCDSRCRRQMMDEAVNMREVHRFIADSILLSDDYKKTFDRIASRKLPSTGRKVAIAGAGPAGLTAAFYLALLGHEVTVYDALPEPGGMLRFALPQYRLPKEVLSREIELIEHLGVKFVLNTRVGSEQLPLNELDDKYDAVFIAIGTWKESWVYQPGTELKGVYPALNFLEAVAKNEEPPLGRRVAVIGGGNAAIDSARTALRRGAEVTVFYRRERKDMPAIEEETKAAKDEGVRFVFLAAPHRIVGDQKGNIKAIEITKTRLGEYDSSGRRRPVNTDEIQRFECDSVIYAVGETVDLDFARASGFSLKENGTIAANRYTLETSRPRFYAGGDVITGASNVSNAMAYGKQAARNIDQQLMETSRMNLLFPEIHYGMSPPEDPSPNHRHHGHHIAISKRIASETEVVDGITAEEAIDEACRCLRCDIEVVTPS